MSTDSGSYVYGVVPAGTTIRSLPIREIEAGRIAALVRDVALAEFTGPGLEANLADRDWLDRAARAHDTVLTEAARSAPVVPLRFCTVLPDDDAVRDALSPREPQVVAAFERLRDRAEWGVKLVADGAPERSPARISAASGREYLAKRREQREQNDRTRAACHDWAERAHELLSACAEEAAALPARWKASSRVLMNGAYLVHGGRQAEFGRRVAELQASCAPSGIATELSGPWPPYTFAAAALGEGWT